MGAVSPRRQVKIHETVSTPQPLGSPRSVATGAETREVTVEMEEDTASPAQPELLEKTGWLWVWTKGKLSKGWKKRWVQCSLIFSHLFHSFSSFVDGVVMMGDRFV
jgi:hypothetical protein